MGTTPRWPARTASAVLVLAGLIAISSSMTRFGWTTHRMGDQVVSTDWPTESVVMLVSMVVLVLSTACFAVIASRIQSRPLAITTLALALATALVGGFGPVIAVLAIALLAIVLRRPLTQS